MEVPILSLSFFLKNEGGTLSLTLEAHDGIDEAHQVYFQIKTTNQTGASSPNTLDGHAFDDRRIYSGINQLLYDNIKKDSQDMIQVWIRQRNGTQWTWSLHEVKFFVSNGGERASAWVNTIFENLDL